MGHPTCRSLLPFLFIAIPGLTKARRLPSALNKAPNVHDVSGTPPTQLVWLRNNLQLVRDSVFYSASNRRHALSVIESVIRRDYVCESSYQTTQLNQYAPIRLHKVLYQ
jgi:hypothetical protein